MVSMNGVSSPSSEARAAETANTASAPVASDPIHERDMALLFPVEVLFRMFDLEAAARTRVVAATPLGVDSRACRMTTAYSRAATGSMPRPCALAPRPRRADRAPVERGQCRGARRRRRLRSTLSPISPRCHMVAMNRRVGAVRSGTRQETAGSSFLGRCTGYKGSSCLAKGFAHPVCVSSIPAASTNLLLCSWPVGRRGGCSLPWNCHADGRSASLPGAIPRRANELPP